MVEATVQQEEQARLRVLFAFGVTQEFFNEDRTRLPEIFKALRTGFADLEERFGVTVLGTLDDDQTMVGASLTWPWTCYIMAEAPDHGAVAAVCNVLREVNASGTPLWRYLKIEARVGRSLFFGEPDVTT